MTRREFVDTYWRYYLILEERFKNITRYIEPVSNNNGVYSIDLVSQLLDIGSEIDVVMKEISGFAQTDHKSMRDYYAPITTKYPGICNQNITAFGEQWKPFETWNGSKQYGNLNWWEMYNSVKHGRGDNMKLATFGMVKESLAALCLLEVMHIKTLADAEKKLDRPDFESEIFTFPDINYTYTRFGNTVLEYSENPKDDVAEPDTLVLDCNNSSNC